MDGIDIFDLDSGRNTRITTPASINSLAWHPDGARLAVACDNRHVYLWDAVTGRQLADMAGHTHTVIEVAFNRTGSLLVSCSWDGTTRLWDPGSGKFLLALRSLSWNARFTSDETIWEYAQEHGFTIVTADSDFVDLAISRGTPPKVMHLENCNCRTSRVEDLLRRHAIWIAELEHSTRAILTIRNAG